MSYAPEYISKVYASITDNSGTLLDIKLLTDNNYFTRSSNITPSLSNISQYLKFGEAINNSTFNVKSFKQNFYGLVGINNISTSEYAGYSGLTSRVATVKIITEAMRTIAREDGDRTISTLNLLSANKNDKVINRFNEFILHATIAVLGEANNANTDNSSAVKSSVTKILESITNTALNDSIHKITWSDSNTISINTMLTISPSDAAVVNFFNTKKHIFQLYNSIVALANEPLSGNYYSTRMAQGVNYVIQYYFYTMLLDTLWQGTRADINASYGDSSTDTSAPATLKNDCWLILTRLANLSALLDADARTVNSLSTSAKTFDNLFPETQQLEDAKSSFASNQRVFNVIVSKNDNNQQLLRNTRWKMLAWAIGLIVFVTVFVMLFNIDLPNVANDNKAMGIIIINGIIATIIIVREIIIAFNQKNS